MNTCNLCHKFVRAADTCSNYLFDINGRIYTPIPYQPKHVTRFNPERKHLRCPVCHVKPDGYHHVGCTLEICPRCGDTWLRCKCAGVKKLICSEASPMIKTAVLPFPSGR
ncbi:MAG: hypothetical protein CSA22_02205 [Deltaproteobacteria bacterium]|nr:MAG: hypothetical protein CSA22_02205 [Deltaproteobacteria bacterium]